MVQNYSDVVVSIHNHSHESHLHHYDVLHHDAWSGLHKANSLLVRFVVPPLIVIAFTGTILVLLGLRRASIPRPHRVLLYTLLVADLVALAVVTPRNYATTALHVDILAYVPLWICQCWYALSVSAIYIPAYTQLALTLERCMAVTRPLEVRQLFTVRSVTCGLTITVTVICVMALSLTNRVHHYSSKSLDIHTTEEALKLCHMAPLQGLVLSYVNLVLWLIVPLLSMIACNILIISCLRQGQSLSMHLHPFCRRRPKQRRLALILVTLSIVYCAAISPFTIYSMYTSVRSNTNIAVLPLDELRSHHYTVNGYLHDDIVWIVTLNCTSIPLVTDWVILVMMSSDIRRNVYGLFGFEKTREPILVTPDTVSGERSQ